MEEGSTQHLETDLIHKGGFKDRQYNSISVPIYQTATFFLEGPDDVPEYKYSRSGNPTRKALENQRILPPLDRRGSSRSLSMTSEGCPVSARRSV